MAASTPVMLEVVSDRLCPSGLACEGRHPPVFLSRIPAVPSPCGPDEARELFEPRMLSVVFDRLASEAGLARGRVDGPDARADMDDLPTVIATVDPRHPGTFCDALPHSFEPGGPAHDAVGLEVEHVRHTMSPAVVDATVDAVPMMLVASRMMRLPKSGVSRQRIPQHDGTGVGVQPRTLGAVRGVVAVVVDHEYCSIGEVLMERPQGNLNALPPLGVGLHARIGYRVRNHDRQDRSQLLEVRHLTLLVRRADGVGPCRLRVDFSTRATARHLGPKRRRRLGIEVTALYRHQRLEEGRRGRSPHWCRGIAV